MKVSPKSVDTKRRNKENSRSVISKKRTKYSPAQLRALDTVFEKCQFPDSELMEGLSGRMQVPVERLGIWFQNRRSKFNRESKGTKVMWMRQQIYGNSEDSKSANQKGNTCHVLSPPQTNSESHQGLNNPKSNLNYHPQPFPVSVAPALYGHLPQVSHCPSWVTSPVDKPITPMMSAIGYHGNTCQPRTDLYNDTTTASPQITTNMSTPVKSTSQSDALSHTPLTLYHLLNDTPRAVSQNASPYISQMTSATPFLSRSCFSSPMYGYGSQFNYHLR